MARDGDVVAALTSDPGSALVALDFDGTLAPIVARPADARPAPGAHDALAALAPRLGGLALVSGRAADEVVRLGGFADIAGVRVLGHYGLQSWHDGRLDTPVPAAGVARARTALPALLAGSDAGVAVEDKVHSLAVHTRQAAAPQDALDALRAPLTDLAAACGLEAVPGRFVLELRPPGVDKGSALRGLVDELGSRIVVYAGDDLGDLPAYDVVDSLRAHGLLGITVASAGSDAPSELAARADLVLAGPAAVVEWLAAIAARLA